MLYSLRGAPPSPLSGLHRDFRLTSCVIDAGERALRHASPLAELASRGRTGVSSLFTAVSGRLRGRRLVYGRRFIGPAFPGILTVLV